MTEEEIGKFREVLRPLYVNLMKSTEGYSRLCPFCMQWGSNWQRNEGILFVGRATNGWLTEERDVTLLLGDRNADNGEIFNCADQMRWIEGQAGVREGYNTNSSAFWRVIRKVSVNFYPEDWSSHVAWSNLCKVAPSGGGNPSNRLYSAQLDACLEILMEEIKFLSPRAVVILTGESWSGDFLRYLNKNRSVNFSAQYFWSRYYCSVCKIGGINFIQTEHPQCKKEIDHVNCLIRLLT